MLGRFSADLSCVVVADEVDVVEMNWCADLSVSVCIFRCMSNMLV